ncbi:hypothetical protein FO519_005639 [Halicephalobus sp. NKZ332]|nr:hypothetical protein FO519_005639 [Halicephalobus sp. NKZ332]
MCPMTTPTASCFDWNKTPYLVKEKIVEYLTPRTLPVFASLSRECYYLYHSLRFLHIVDSVSISIKIEKNGEFEAEIYEGEDIDDDLEKSENLLDRNASSHLGIEFRDSEKIVFDDLKQFKKFLKHVHVVKSMEIDVSCRDTEESRITFEEIFEDFQNGFESIQKLIIHRIPDKYLFSIFKNCEKLDSLSLLSTRRSFEEKIDPKILHQSLQQLRSPLRRFVCDYLTRPNDILLDLISKKSDNLELLYIFGASEESIQNFFSKSKLGEKCKFIFSFSEGFYQWNRVEKVLKNSSDWIEKFSVNNLPAAFRMSKSGSDILVGLIKPYRALL